MTDADPIWTPSPERVEQARITAFRRLVEERTGRSFTAYEDFWQWSVEDLDGFWSLFAEHVEVPFHQRSDQVLAEERMPGAVWFPGATVNFAELALARTGGEVAVVARTEGGGREEVTWDELRGRVGAVQAWLREQGVEPGDRVVGFLPNIAETVVAFLATVSIGAVWSVCAQEYAPQGAADRFAQLDPVVLIAADGYHYGGKVHDRTTAAAELRDLLPTVRATLHVDHIGAQPLADSSRYADVVASPRDPDIVPVAFDHPLWVLYSSGTTGRPKGIVHGHGGALLEMVKLAALHVDLHEGSVFHWFSTPSWMMWNVQVAGLLLGARIVLLDGSPGHPHADSLWDLVAEEGVTYFGTSAAYLIACHKAGSPAQGRDLSALTGLGSTGSPLPPSTAEWLVQTLPDVWLAPVSGGTDVASGFCGGVPTEPMRAAEMQGRAMACAMEAWDESGQPVVGEVGELVLTRPLPSMPLYFWDDPEGERYRDAYFDTFPGIWRHGDWCTITHHGGVMIHGRSDATMNRLGVRIGSAEIYETLDRLPEIQDCLIVGVEQEDGGYWMPLFVQLAEGAAATDEDKAALADRLRATIRSEVSPRHVPDEVIFVHSLARTMTGKRLEVPVKRILQGMPVAQAANPRSVTDPSALDELARIAQERRSGG